MAALLLPWPHTAAATETRVRFLGKGIIDVLRKACGDPCSVRLHGDLILSHGSRGVGPRGRLVDEIDQVIREFDSQAKVFHPSVFRRIDICSKLIHELLAKALVTSEHDLDADNWLESLRTPALNIAMAIARCVAHWASLVPGTGYDDLDIDITIPQLRVCLVYREPKAPLLPRKKAAPETEAPRVLARGRKRCRESETDELCAICLLNLELQGELLDLKIEDEGTARLPCSHAFHSRCILPWFHRALKCPTCRRGVMECFRSVGWASRRGVHTSRSRRRTIYTRRSPRW